MIRELKCYFGFHDGMDIMKNKFCIAHVPDGYGPSMIPIGFKFVRRECEYCKKDIT